MASPNRRAPAARGGAGASSTAGGPPERSLGRERSIFLSAIGVTPPALPGAPGGDPSPLWRPVAVDVAVQPALPRAPVRAERLRRGVERPALVDVGAIGVPVAALARVAAAHRVAPVRPDAERL